MRKIVSIAKKLIPHDIRVFFRKLNWRLRYIIQITSNSTNFPKVFCPIAEKEFKAFVKIGSELVSPTNGARKRQRLVWLYLKQEQDILNKQARVLHIAPELSYMNVLKRQKNLTYIPGDKMVEGYSNQKGVENIDITKLKFEDNSFDYIICNHVLEHIDNDIKAMSEMFRVLKPNGIAVITVPIDESLEKTLEDPSITSPKDREKYYWQWDHLRLYGTDIKDRMDNIGFQTSLYRYSDNFTKENFDRYGLSTDLIIIGKK